MGRPQGTDVLLDGLGEYIEKVEESKRRRSRHFALFFIASVWLLGASTMKSFEGVFTTGVSVGTLAIVTAALIPRLIDIQRNHKRALAKLRRVYELASRIEDSFARLDSPTRLLLEVKLADAGYLLGQVEDARSYSELEPTAPRSREDTPSPREIEPASS